MAMSQTVRNIAAAGTAWTTLAVPLSTETIIPVEDLILHCENGATSATVTFTDGGVSPAGGAGTAQVVTVGANVHMLIAVNPALVNPATGLISITFSNITTITAEWLSR